MGKQVLDMGIMVNGSRQPSVIRDRSGASAVEFALILPVLLLLVFGTFQVSLLMYSYNLMVGAARDATRAMAVCTISNYSDAIAQARKALPPWVSSNDWTITPVIQAGLTGDVSMTISVDPRKAAVISYIPFTFPALTAFTEMRKEPLAFGGCGGATS